MAVRDRTRYRQELAVERFELARNSTHRESATNETNPRKLGERTTAVTVEPSLTPDATGRYEVLVRIVSDTDDQGRPKNNIDPKAQPGLLVESLWDELFFPLQEEKLPFLKFEVLPSPDPAVAKFHFEPTVEPRTLILASGTVTIDAATATVKAIEIESLHNLRSMNKQLAKLESISAHIEFTPFRQLWNLPSTATGQGISHLPHLDGFFRFHFKESGYEAVMKIPEPETSPL